MITAKAKRKLKEPSEYESLCMLYEGEGFHIIDFSSDFEEKKEKCFICGEVVQKGYKTCVRCSDDFPVAKKKAS